MRIILLTITLIQLAVNIVVGQDQRMTRPGDTILIRQPLLHRNLDSIVIQGPGNREGTKISPALTTHVPTLAGGVETLIKTMAGVSNRNELSSQYSVRGGNFDENLIYLNGIELIRPFLVKTGQQEGLSPINPDMVQGIDFYNAAFAPKFGDKLSSVLDVTYRKPSSTTIKGEIGALGGSLTMDLVSPSKKIQLLAGIRHKDTRYLLGTLDQKGAYSPSFTDFQGYLNWDATSRFSISLVTNIQTNSYSFVPKTQLTKFGTLMNPLQFMVWFDGRESDRYRNQLIALNMSHRPSANMQLGLTISTYRSKEQESYDILGEYYLSDVSQTPSSATAADSTLILGTGSYLNHARNHTLADLLVVTHQGSWIHQIHHFTWKISAHREWIQDQTSEWQMRDSAGYSLPVSGDPFKIYRSVKGDNKMVNNRLFASIEDHLNIPIFDGSVRLTTGITSQYWEYNHQLLVSPRFLISYRRNESPTIFRGSAGIYQQMPFYRELKDPNAQLQQLIRAQRSINYLLGFDHLFGNSAHPFQFTTECWYKDLERMIPYQIDNLNIQYLPNQQSRGYAAGIDLRINGEFVKGAQSWGTLSFMKTEERIIPYSSGTLTGPSAGGYIPRPSDQRINCSLFFQDYFPGYPKVRMSMTLFYSSGLPFGPPTGDRYQDRFRMPSYRRVDVGFTRNLFEKNTIGIRESWIGLELFNLFDIKNTASHLWISDIHNQMYGIPNYLTGRRVNLKFSVRF